MNEQSRVLGASLAGAAIGALLGYFYFTEKGRRVRDQLEPRLEDFQQEMRKLRTTIGKAQQVANEGWRSLTELVGERGSDRERGGWQGQGERRQEWQGQPREEPRTASSH